MEIASCDNKVKEKYKIAYQSPHKPLFCFATTNFYNEITKPQQRGMLKFFDKSFIAKNIDENFIAKLSTLPEYINEKL